LYGWSSVLLTCVLDHTRERGGRYDRLSFRIR
jgi:hypothetical protein